MCRSATGSRVPDRADMSAVESSTSGACHVQVMLQVSACLAPDYLSRFCTLLTSAPGHPLLRSADANKLLVQRSCTTSFGPRSFGSSSLTPWNDMPAHLHTVQPGLNFKCLQTIAENCFVPDCFGVVTSRAFVTVLIW